MTQGELFSSPIEKALDHPIARATDPATSHEAAARVTASGARGKQHRMVLDMLKSWPGHTSQEMAQHFGLLDRYQIARRLPELESAGLAEKMPARDCAVSGSSAHPWRPVNKKRIIERETGNQQLVDDAEPRRVWQIGPDGTEYFVAHSEEEMKAYYRLNSDAETCESDLRDEFQEVTDLDETFAMNDDGKETQTTWRKLADSATQVPSQISTGYN